MALGCVRVDLTVGLAHEVEGVEVAATAARFDAQLSGTDALVGVFRESARWLGLRSPSSVFHKKTEWRCTSDFFYVSFKFRSSNGFKC